MSEKKLYITGERIKQLRETHGLSRNELAKQLREKYGVTISKSSLDNYENTNPKDTRAGSIRMNVEFLICLADFFCVSTDYLLGRSSSLQFHDELDFVRNATGLSDENALLLYQVYQVNSHTLDPDREMQYKKIIAEKLGISSDDYLFDEKLSYYCVEIAKYLDLMIDAYKKDSSIQSIFDLLSRDIDDLFSISHIFRSHRRDLNILDVQHILANQLAERISFFLDNIKISRNSKWVIEKIPKQYRSKSAITDRTKLLNEQKLKK